MGVYWKTKRGANGRAGRWILSRTGPRKGHDTDLYSMRDWREPDWDLIAQRCRPGELAQARERWEAKIGPVREQRRLEHLRAIPSMLNFYIDQMAALDELPEDERAHVRAACVKLLQAGLKALDQGPKRRSRPTAAKQGTARKAATKKAATKKAATKKAATKKAATTKRAPVKKTPAKAAARKTPTRPPRASR